MSAEEMVAQAIKGSGRTIKAVSRMSGVPYSKLQPSVNGHRELRAGEYLSLCSVLGLDPRGYMRADGAGSASQAN